MKDTINLLDVVALTTDLPDYNLLRGQVGTVVDILADGAAYEVEFSDRSGRMVESVGLRSRSGHGATKSQIVSNIVW